MPDVYISGSRMETKALVAVDPASQIDEDELILVHARRVRSYQFSC